MSDRLAVTLTVDELVALVVEGVRAALAGREAIDARVAVLAGEELTLADVMTLCKIKTRKTLYRWRRELGFPAPRQFGQGVRWRRTDVDAWIASRETSGPGSVSRRQSKEGRAAATAAQ